MRAIQQQLRRLATLEEKLNARSVRGLLPLKDATSISNAYHALAELDGKRQQGMELNEDEKERHDLLQTFVPRMVRKIVLPAGKHYSFADFSRDEQRFYELSRQRRKYQNGGDPLTRGDEIELAFLTAHKLFYEYSPEGSARRGQKE